MKSISFEIEANVKILTDKTDRRTNIQTGQTDRDEHDQHINPPKCSYPYQSLIL